MSQTATALLVKFAGTFILALIAFSLLVNNLWYWALLVAIIATALNYVLGDLVVLPKFGNIVASAGDGVMAALVAYIVGLVIPVFTVTVASLFVFAILIAAMEYFFHQYLLKSEKVEP